MRLFWLHESGRVVTGRQGVKEMSTDTIRSHPTFTYMSRPWVTGPMVPAGRWARRPLVSHGLESQLDVTAVNKLFTVIYHSKKIG